MIKIKMKKGQISLEFVTYIGILLFILVLATYSVIAAGGNLRGENNGINARKLASELAQEINIAVETGDGYYHTFNMPELFSTGINYSVNFTESRFVGIVWDEGYYSLPYLAENVSGTVRKGENTIKNSNGVILFV